MRIVYPTDKNMGYLSQIGAHFGKAKFYTIITLKNGKIINVEGVENPGHSGGACSNAVANIMNLNPDALVVSGIGSSPAQGFARAGLNLYFDSTSKTVQESVTRVIKNELKKSDGQGTCSAN